MFRPIAFVSADALLLGLIRPLVACQQWFEPTQVGSGSTEAESKDRATLGLPDAQQRLLEAVRSAMRAASPAGMLVVVVISAGPVYLDPACADAILYAGYPGMEAGHGIADVIFGRVSPSARFPVTVYDSQYLVQGILVRC